MEAGGCNLLNGKNVVNIEDSLPPLLFFSCTDGNACLCEGVESSSSNSEIPREGKGSRTPWNRSCAIQILGESTRVHTDLTFRKGVYMHYAFIVNHLFIWVFIY